jgi:ABC-2 type transport system ATP-binding protein
MSMLLETTQFTTHSGEIGVRSIASEHSSLRSRAPAIYVEEVSKAYGATIALDDVSLRVVVGEITALVGPNGAGKTTLLEILMGVRAADHGRVEVRGADPGRDAAAIRGRVGVMFQPTALPPLATAGELLSLFRLDQPRSRDHRELLRKVGLSDYENKTIDKMTVGQKQRLALAVALVGEPDVLILDEPTTALDPQARRVAWDLIADPVRRANRAVLISTHSMEEAESLCSNVVLIDHGRLNASGTPRSLVATHCPGYRVTCDASIEDLPALRRVLPADAEVIEAGDTASITVPVADIAAAATIAHVIGTTHGVRQLTIATHSLDDVFLKITGRSLRD